METQRADWQNKQLTIGADGLAKNRQSRAVDFNQRLEAHLKEMQTRRAPDSVWLFPSPRRGNEDRPAKTFVETMRLVRTAARLPRFGFHDCRHHFISMGVMSGIDYMTIARWVGRQDGGVLIGKKLCHLPASWEPARSSTSRLRAKKFFEPSNPHCEDFADVTKARRAVECATRFTAVSELHHNLPHANFTNPLFNRSAFQR